MKLTDALLGEHGAFYVLFDQIEEIAATESALAQLRGATTVLGAMVYAHATLEEDLLFQAVMDVAGPNEAALVQMRQEHEEMERILGHIEQAQDVEEAVSWIPEALTAARDHFHKEEEILFPMAETLLGDAKLRELGDQWARARRVRIPG